MADVSFTAGQDGRPTSWVDGEYGWVDRLLEDDLTAVGEIDDRTTVMSDAGVGLLSLTTAAHAERSLRLDQMPMNCADKKR